MTVKDMMRMQDLRDKANGEVRRQINLACAQANRITSYEKCVGRQYAAIEVFGQDSVVARIFRDRQRILLQSSGGKVDKRKYLAEEVSREELVESFGNDAPKIKKKITIKSSSVNDADVNELIAIYRK